MGTMRSGSLLIRSVGAIGSIGANRRKRAGASRGDLNSKVRILGTGLIAGALVPHRAVADDAVVFARGVADLSCVDDREYRREVTALYSLIRECIKSGERLVYLSGGGAVYGPTGDCRREDTPLFPTSAYGRHQLVCESVILGAPIRSLVVRLPNIVGAPQNLRQLVPSLVQQALTGRARIQEQATRDILRVDDAAATIASLASLPSPPPLINVASGRSTSAALIFAEIQSILGTSAEVDFLPGGERQVFSIELLARTLDGIRPATPTYVRTALADYVPLLAGQQP